MDNLKKLYGTEYVKKFEEQDPNRIARLIKLIPLDKNNIVLDIACGDGALSHLIHDKVGKYYGVDFSEEFIKKAKSIRKFSNVNFINNEIVEFCSETSEKFDQIFALDFTEHVYDDELLKILEAVKLKLKPNGMLYLHTPNGNYFLEILKNKGIMKQIPEHVAVRNANQYKYLLSVAGYKKIEIKYLSHYDSFLNKFHFLSYIPFIGKFFEARLFIKCK